MPAEFEYLFLRYSLFLLLRAAEGVLPLLLLLYELGPMPSRLVYEFWLEPKKPEKLRGLLRKMELPLAEAWALRPAAVVGFDCVLFLYDDILTSLVASLAKCPRATTSDSSGLGLARGPRADMRHRLLPLSFGVFMETRAKPSAKSESRFKAR